MDRSSPDLGFYSSDNHHDNNHESDSDSDLDANLDFYDNDDDHDDHDDHDDDHHHHHDHAEQEEAEFQHQLHQHLHHHLHHLHQLRHVLGINLTAEPNLNHEDDYMNHIFGDSDNDGFDGFDDDSYLDNEDLDVGALLHVGDNDDDDDDDHDESHSDHSDDSTANRESSEDSLFVDQRPSPSPSPNRLPPIAQLVPEVRRAGQLQGNRESSFGFGSLNSDEVAFLDQLVEMEVARPVRRPRTMAAARSMTPAANAEVIDLTQDDDDVRQPRPNHNPNPRRQTLNHRTPSLNRSDGSLLGNAGAADIIDLTMDDPTPPPRRQHAARAQARPNLPRPPPPFVDLVNDDEDDNLGAGGSFRAPGAFSHFVHQLQHRLQPAAMFGIHGILGLRDVTALGRSPANNPLGAHGPDLNYGLHRAGQEHTAPKPAHVPPKPAREGFTRATGEASEDVAVCAGCEEELKYDPDESRADMPPQKRARNKKDNEEHHFWAVKECGHVYCKSCYEGRGRAKGKTAHFRAGPGKNKALCNVPDCESEVSSKMAWVGLFL
ncbi:hypothetical protein QC761_700720 [Podospora bellae-mahoneyi]|uniref:Cell cycle control protein n=1 Tax=Podospora bellae-mahoneyi TaxID=2093777 RepID=A0ABR0F7C0_9PEZI|nr:hypothetical protein QC761_700720 [Podospora bellae-mahoneyi]